LQKVTIIVLVVVVLVFCLLVASYERGCHYNGQLSERLYCTDPADADVEDIRNRRFQRVREAAGLGFEPRLLGPEPSVLPLDDPATGRPF
jgi:hypothetical protein